jgi:hypothetical protein
MVDAADSKSVSERSVGSSPTTRTKLASQIGQHGICIGGIAGETRIESSGPQHSGGLTDASDIQTPIWHPGAGAIGHGSRRSARRQTDSRRQCIALRFDQSENTKIGQVFRTTAANCVKNKATFGHMVNSLRIV